LEALSRAVVAWASSLVVSATKNLVDERNSELSFVWRHIFFKNFLSGIENYSQHSHSLSNMTPDEWQQARLIGENDDDEQINSADDEELDSDAAFDESDEDRYEGFFSSKVRYNLCILELLLTSRTLQKKQADKKKKPTVRFADVDLNEDGDMASPEEQESEEEGGDSHEFIDLLDVLDGKGEIDMGSDDEKRPKPSRPQEDDEEEHDDEEQEEEETEEEQDKVELDPFSASEDEAPEASEQFQKFVSTLDTTAQKRKADDPAKDSRSRKRRLIAERTEAGVEDEFRAHSSGLFPRQIFPHSC
jgi:U3 small nucleolar RNA-associated protein 14